jgi:hypothetical protein
MSEVDRINSKRKNAEKVLPEAKIRKHRKSQLVPLAGLAQP